MTVHFIGAGPGAADLLTLRGRDLIAASPVCLYAGSLVPEGVLAHCPPGARIINTAPLSLDEIIAELVAAHADGKDVARLHSGDLSIWSRLAPGARLVAHSVTLETEALLGDLHQRHGGDLMRVEIAHAAPLGRYRSWEAARPVVQWSAVR